MQVSARKVSSNQGYTGGLWLFSMSIVQLSKNSQSFTPSFNHLLLCTCSVKVVTCIISEDYVCAVHGLIVSNLVLVQHLRVENCNLHRPHAGHSKQNYLITPEISPEQHAKVLFEGERRVPTPGRILPFPPQPHTMTSKPQTC